MSHEQNFSDHISDKKLRELAVPSVAEKGFVALASVLTPEESAHFRECAKCIDALSNIARELIERKKAG
jgi:hypothetical protein